MFPHWPIPYKYPKLTPGAGIRSSRQNRFRLDPASCTDKGGRHACGVSPPADARNRPVHPQWFACCFLPCMDSKSRGFGPGAASLSPKQGCWTMIRLRPKRFLQDISGAMPDCIVLGVPAIHSDDRRLFADSEPRHAACDHGRHHTQHARWPIMPGYMIPASTIHAQLPPADRSSADRVQNVLIASPPV